MNNTDAMSLLADLFNAPKAPAKPKAPAPKALKAHADLPLHKAFAQRKTGYVTWHARARVVILQRQECRCCGEVTETVKDELFALTNGASHSVWLRHEGYGIAEPEGLPIEVERLDEVKMVSACGKCADLDLELALLSRKQMELML